MTGNDWMELTVLERRKYNYLVEVMDVSRQLGEALDRNDQVSVKLLVAMRQEPILHLKELQTIIADRRSKIEDDSRLQALLDGAPPQIREEAAYIDQVGIARRLLEQILVLDRRLNTRLAGKDSYYNR